MFRFIKKALNIKLKGIYELVFSPWVMLFFGLLIYILMSVGAIIVKDLIVTAQTVQAARAAAINPNSIDPTTSQPIGQEAVNLIAKYVPVTNTSTAYTTNSVAPLLTSIRSEQLSLNINLYDGSYVTTTMIYGITLPGSWLLQDIGFTPGPIPINAQYSFFREW